MNERLMTKKMIAILKEGQQKATSSKIQPLQSDNKVKKETNFLQEAKDLMEKVEREMNSQKKKLNEVEMMGSNISSGNEQNKAVVIAKNNPNFGDVRVSQEESLIKTVGESVDLGEDALKYYPDRKDLVLDGKINALNLAFQFRYNDPSGDGCYIWVEGLQLTETNSRTLGKIRDAFMNWKNVLLENGDLMEKLYKMSTRN
jgi:hypothetical protein